ncbi:MAG: insulinase family protein, partial [Cruoricaptor ignavus]|nr:insulinase family protein [Cruoricaptor ignavus]
VRIYTLKNGLKVYLAQNFDAPRIQTFIPVRTGSNSDPADNTGLAHYLEHMMFKGTSKIGSLDWEKESQLLDQLAEFFEEHKAENDTEKKKEIYKKIDEVSQIAAQYVAPNEYDKCVSSLGATQTNAHTWLNETVYKNNIPKNEFEKWLKIESERFSEIVLRLFHTELETVYEEFNRAQDSDHRQTYDAMMGMVFPTHPNGQQTTLGKAEHLKNPSMKAIHQFFNQYYVPNNYAMILVGDLDFEETIVLVNQYFGKFEYRELPQKPKIVEEPMDKIVSKTVKSQSFPRLHLAWRTESYGTREYMLAEVICNILANKGEAGLLDLNINQKQKMLTAQAFSFGFKEYGILGVVLVPKEGQSFDEALALFFQQIDLIKKGEFPDWLITAIINDFRLQKIKGAETAAGLANALCTTYIKGQTWEGELNELDEFTTISKQEVIDFANDFLRENYVVVYKEQGENEELIRVENPGITPIKINRDAESEFLKNILNEKTPDIEPVFVDYKKEIFVEECGDKKLNFILNKNNDIATISYVFPFGKDHDRKIALAINTLQYLGTENYTPEALREEFYKIGVECDFKISEDSIVIQISGLEENLEQGVALFDHWVTCALPDQDIYQEFVETILESRSYGKQEKSLILKMLVNYAKFGAKSRATDVLSEEQLLSISCSEITEIAKNIFDFPYQILFFGKDYEKFKNYIQPYLKTATKPIPEKKKYPKPETKNHVYFIDYDMVQVELCKVAKGNLVDTQNLGKMKVFNEYFGSGLSSVVFQEIRESKSLAYSAYVAYNPSAEIGQPDYITSYLGTQPDKLMIAVDTLDELMQDFPQISLQFNNSKNSALKKMASNRITGMNIFFSREINLKLNSDYDLRESIYNEINDLDLQKLTEFYNQSVKPLSYNVAIMGKKSDLDLEAVAKMGELKELTLEEIFGY